jgi:hypothetical protein
VKDAMCEALKSVTSRLAAKAIKALPGGQFPLVTIACNAH